MSEPLLMGIVNATPDSFSDPQGEKTLDALVARAHALAEDGAAIVDVGGESGRTDRPVVPVEEEQARVVGLIERLAADGLTVSIDTWRAPVARAALAAGASMVNDVSGLSDVGVADACAEAGAQLVITHTRVPPKVKGFPDYRDVVADVVELLSERAALAVEHGVGEEHLIFDPGIDIAKTPAESIEVLRRLPEVAALGRRRGGADPAGARRRRRARLPGGALGALQRGGARAAAGSGAAPGARVSELTIAQLSDPHCGSPHFVPSLLDRALVEINELRPDVVIVSGDLTSDGLRAEYQLARDYLDRIDCERMIVIPGNHDSRNVGYVHFEELFGERRSELHADGISIVAVDSTEPDLDHGVIGRGRYEWIEERFGANEAFLRIFVLHHHLLPVPGTGRERNIVHDAGDTLECLQRANVQLVLSGHKHVPYAWRLENLFVVNAGTVSTTRLRGKTKPCYNVIEASPERVTVYRKYPFHERDAIISFDPRTYEYEKDQSLLGETAHG
jgi:Icc protein